MRRLLSLLLMTLVFGLAACTQEPIVDDPVVCDADQYQEGDECKDYPICEIGMMLSGTVCVDDPDTHVVDGVLYDFVEQHGDMALYKLRNLPTEFTDDIVLFGAYEGREYYFSSGTHLSYYVVVSDDQTLDLLEALEQEWFTLADLIASWTVGELLSYDIVCDLGDILVDNACVDDPDTVVIDNALFVDYHVADGYVVVVRQTDLGPSEGERLDMGVWMEEVYYFDHASEHDRYRVIKNDETMTLLEALQNEWLSWTDLITIAISELQTEDLVCEAGQVIHNDGCEVYQPTRYDLSQETYTISTLFEVDDAHSDYNTGKPLYTPIATHEGITYLIYVDVNLRPRVAKITDAETYEIAYLDTDEVDVYYNREDGHHFWSIGVDKDGYIHVVGDMHNYAVFNSPQDHMPDRYRYGRINYWRSDNPHDISSFTWYGDSDTMAPQGTGHTYVAFTNDYQGNLYYYARVVSPLAPTSEMKKKGFGISAYDTETKTWTSLGEINEFGNDVVIYEDDAEFGDYNYSKIHGWLSFGTDNKVHVSAPILNTSLEYPLAVGHYSSHAVYVAYDPVTGLFHRADGTVVAPPLRIDDDGTNDQVDVVYEILEGQMMATLVSIAVDYLDRPVVQLFDQNTGQYVHMRYNGSSWDNLGDLGIPPGNDTAIHNDLSGVITIIRDDKYITRMFDETNMVTIDLSGYGWSFILDRKYLSDTGNYRLLPVFRASEPNTIRIIEVIIDRPIEYPDIY